MVKANLTSNTMAKMGKNEPVSLDALARICVALKCNIGDILDMDVGTAKFFLEMGMHCLGCPASRGESVEQACRVHGTDCDELVNKINEYLENK